MLVVMEALAAHEALEFEQLLRDEDVWASRPMIVTTFLALLELTRLEAIGLYQGVDDVGVPRGPIHVRRRVRPGDRAWIEHVSELM
jgi:chromatin segregation and condensation protein Rec8/ScpA/Scc1 (kleisin family)